MAKSMDMEWKRTSDNKKCKVTTFVDAISDNTLAWYSAITIGEEHAFASLFPEGENQSPKAATNVHQFIIEKINEGSGITGVANSAELRAGKFLREVQEQAELNEGRPPVS